MKKHITTVIFALFCAINLSAQINVVNVEYFFDVDPGINSGTLIAIPPGDNIEYTLNPDLSGLSPGLHRFCFRVQDYFSRWSLTNCTPIYIQSPPTANVDLAEMEYFFDTDPGEGNATPLALSPNNDLEYAFMPDLSSLTPGFHRLCFRVKDVNNQWSHTNCTPLYIQHGSIPLPDAEIVSMEYFVDTDPGFGMGTPVTPNASGTDVTFDFSLDLSGISQGVHTLYFRALDENNQWSLIGFHRFLFFNDPLLGFGGDIIQMEYFIGDDPGAGSANQITGFTAAPDVEGNFTADLSSIEPGIHQLFMRAKSDRDIWSPTRSIVFEVVDNCPSIVTYENTNELPAETTAEQTIMAGNYGAGDVVVLNEQEVLFTAGEKVLLEPGFVAESGSVFIAQIGACPGPSAKTDEEAPEENQPAIEQQTPISNIRAYPNPFGESVNIVYHLNETSDVNLSLYNLHGRKVRDLLLNQRQQVGKYTIELPNCNLASGMYLCVLQANEHRKTIKLMKK